jgi:hypothetical protein
MGSYVSSAFLEMGPAIEYILEIFFMAWYQAPRTYCKG